MKLHLPALQVKGTTNGDPTLSTDATLSALAALTPTEHTINLATTPYTNAGGGER